MIRFEILPPRVRELAESDYERLGRLLGKSLRWRSSREVGVRYVSEKEMARLNKSYRGLDRPTDVLSFEPGPLSDASRFMLHASRFLGDLVICPAYAKRSAKRRGITLKEELLRLLTHGVLHLGGYDHSNETEESKMFGLQERVVSGFLPHKV